MIHHSEGSSRQCASGQLTSNFQFREIDAAIRIMVKLVAMVVMAIMVVMVIMVAKVTMVKMVIMDAMDIMVIMVTRACCREVKIPNKYGQMILWCLFMYRIDP